MGIHGYSCGLRVEFSSTLPGILMGIPCYSCGLGGVSLKLPGILISIPMAIPVA